MHPKKQVSFVFSSSMLSSPNRSTVIIIDLFFLTAHSLIYPYKSCSLSAARHVFSLLARAHTINPLE